MRLVRFLALIGVFYVVAFLGSLFLLYGTGAADWEGDSGAPLNSLAEHGEWIIYTGCAVVAVVMAVTLDRRRTRKQKREFR